jgi:peptide deformylase
MAVREVIRMGHPTLRQKAQPYTKEEIQSEAFGQLLQDLFDTMVKEGGIGIAAPQINVSKAVTIIQVDPGNERYDTEEETPVLILINPKVTVLDQTRQGFWEGCLSVPGLRGFVERPRKVRIDYLDQEGQPQELEAEGFLATVFQHELDHLFGTLYVDHIQDKTKLMYEQEYLDHHQNDDEGEID